MRVDITISHGTGLQTLSKLQISSQTQIDQLKTQLQFANEQTAMLERQLKQNCDHSEELVIARASERKRFDELSQEKKKIAEMASELQNLRDKNRALQQRCDEMFARAADTQTTNQILQHRTNEMMMKAQLDSDKCQSLEKIHEDVIAQLDKATAQITELLAERGMQCQNNEFEREISNLKRELLDLQAHYALAKGDSKVEVPRLIRLYQQRAGLYQEQLDSKMREIINLKNRIVQDQRSLIELQRELRRAKADLRLALLRYESTKGEAVMARNSVANRDETIRLLNREIDRLRNLLKINAPLQQRWREIQRAENDTFEGIQRTQADIAKAERSRTRYADNRAVSLYFDRMLDRSRAALTKLELRRKDLDCEI
jgi:chromosome segregation ATPase